MDIGRTSPRHQRLALLYRQSKTLQAYINEYFIVVVNFCHNIVQFAQKCTIRKLTATMSDSIVRTTQKDLATWAAEIQSEMNLLTAKRIEDEAAENTLFRSFSRDLSKSVSRQHKLAARLRVLDECSKYDYKTTWKQVRKSGTTNSFTKDPVYEQWKMRPDACTLLYFGKLGCGKSVTLANMVDDINLSSGLESPLVVFFFVRQDLPESLKARTVIGSVVRQLLESQPDQAVSGGQTSLDVQEMLALLRAAFSRKMKTFLVLDGLDLCAASEKEEIIEFTRELQASKDLTVCISIRQEASLDPNAMYRGFMARHIILVRDNNAEIASFIDDELSLCIANSSLVLGRAQLILKIREALLHGADGMFLWVALQIKTLCTMQTDWDIEEALTDLPADLSETYLRILQRSPSASKPYQRLVLMLIASAREPLKINELREALSVTPGTTDWTTAKIINDVYSTLKSCGCLIDVDEEELTVRFVHPSVQDFLLTRSIDPGSPPITLNDCHKIMADVIVTYLSYGIFDNQLSTSRIPAMHARNTPSKVIESVTAASKCTQSLALKLLAHRKPVDFDPSWIIAQELGSRAPRKPQEFVFLHYARQWCLEHVCAITPTEDLGAHTRALLPALLERNANGAMPGPAPSVAFMMAVEHDKPKVIEFLLHSTCRTFANELFRYELEGRHALLSPIALAVCKGNKHMSQKLQVVRQGTLRSTTSYLSSEPPCYLVWLGDVYSVRELFSYHNNFNKLNRFTKLEWRCRGHICQSGRSLAACAIWGGQMEMLKLLLQDPTFDPNIGAKGHTPIEEALAESNASALELLLASGRVFLEADLRIKLESMAEAAGFGEGRAILAQFTVPQRHGMASPPADNQTQWSKFGDTMTDVKNPRLKSRNAEGIRDSSF